MGPSNKGNGRTVKEWKEAQRNRQSGSSSIRASRASTSSDSTTFKRQRPLLFSIFNDSKEGLPDHAVSKQNPFVYTARPERSNQPSQSTRTVRSSSTHSDSSAKGLFASQERTTTTHIPRNDFSLAGLQNSSGPEQSKLCHAISYSGKSNLSSWAAPVAAKSTYTSVTASPTRGHISQPLSPIPFATQSTEVHIPSKRESTKRSDQLATSVCIPSNNTLPPKTRDSPSQP
ncbi:hypothetical protein BGZ60DRAFT_535889 [Tricladium varicosporioides]|nr:hypothetical protein BGZ60DRAFT_535889 [Hymenoscyphus varicosporioides]